MILDDNTTEENINVVESDELNRPIEIVYDTGKDFYKGIRGELRFKAEGLFKKAREKGISIEDIEISTIKESHAEIPGLGVIDLPTYVVKVKGMITESEQAMIDGKQMDFYNRYQKYVADVIYEKNVVKDERGKVVYSDKRPMMKKELDLGLNDWEKFQIGKALIEDKEFGLEKTITGACDRVIRKLMGENDWLYPGEARLLEEEFNEVDKKAAERKIQKSEPSPTKRASDKQIAYLKTKIKNSGLNPENPDIMLAIMEAGGYNNKKLEDLSISDASRLIDIVNNIIPSVKNKFESDTEVIQ
jgi:hypothetical protein